jgi:hypothetical protein
LEKIPLTWQDNSHRPESPIQVPQTQSAFIGVHNETLPVAAMPIGNEYRSPFAIHVRDAAPTPTMFAEIEVLMMGL